MNLLRMAIKSIKSVVQIYLEKLAVILNHPKNSFFSPPSLFPL